MALSLNKPFFILAVILAVFIPSALYPATLAWREVLTPINKISTIICRDVPDHTLNLEEFKGTAFWKESHELAVVRGQMVTDTTKGSGSQLGYFSYYFADKSSLQVKYQGTITPGNPTIYNGKLTVTKGTGRYISITGKGGYTGKKSRLGLEALPTPSITLPDTKDDREDLYYRDIKVEVSLP